MNQQSNNQEKKPAWVKLHIAPQAADTAMPDHVVGLLSSETAGAYVLTKVLEMKQNEENYETEVVEVDKMLLVSRTYVWAVEILGESPSMGGDLYEAGEEEGL